MRLLLDIHVAPRTAEFLRRLGHDVERVGDRLDPRTPDSGLVAAALADRRVVVSHDLDFSALVALSGESGPSVISLRLGTTRIEHVNERLRLTLERSDNELARGAIVTVQDDRLRIRLLPIR